VGAVTGDKAVMGRLISREIALMTRAKKTPDGRRIDWSRAPKSRKRG
jgi:hypothetical protein